MNVVRCLLATLLILVFGGGAVLASEPNGRMSQSAVEMSAHASVPDACCGGSDKSTTTAACSAFGSCFQAVHSFAATAFLLPIRAVYPAAVEHIAGFKGSPEPFPPKAPTLA